MDIPAGRVDAAGAARPARGAAVAAFASADVASVSATRRATVLALASADVARPRMETDVGSVSSRGDVEDCRRAVESRCAFFFSLSYHQPNEDSYLIH